MNKKELADRLDGREIGEEIAQIINQKREEERSKPMKDCLNCINYMGATKGKKCRTMLAPAKGYACHMTKAQALKTEREIINHTQSPQTIKEAAGQIAWIEGR